MNTPQVELKARPLTPASASVVDAALGDMHGKLTEGGHEDIGALSQNSVTMTGLSLSVYGLNTYNARCAPHSQPLWGFRALVKALNPLNP